MSVAHIFSSSSKLLHGEQDRLWSQAVRDLRLDLDPYTCKASYVCGMLRQFIEAAGLQLGREYHVGALVSAASAAELVGWCYKGAISTDQPGKRLGDGVRYLQEVGPAYAGPDQQRAADLAGRGEPIFVRDVQHHLAKGLMPGGELDHEASWRPRQPWEEQTPSGVWRFVPTGGPAATGSP